MDLLNFLKWNSKKKSDNYQKDNDLPAKEIVLGQTLYKRDITGFAVFLDDMPNMKRIFTELTWAIRNNHSVENYLTQAKLMNDDEIRQIAKKGFTDIATFLSDMLEIKENEEVKKDLNACIEAINILSD